MADLLKLIVTDSAIAVVVLQSIYLDSRMRQVHRKLDQVTQELVELRHLELVRRKENSGKS